jgi:hypothetical protein
MAIRNWSPVTDAELDRQIEAARERSEIAMAEPRATSARYNALTGRIEIELSDGCLFGFPARGVEGLDGAGVGQLAQVELIGNGYALHWEDLDVDFSVAGLLAGRFGSRLWMREHARRAGSVRSEAKAKAARANGAKGGRPPKKAI